MGVKLLVILGLMGAPHHWTPRYVPMNCWIHVRVTFNPDTGQVYDVTETKSGCTGRRLVMRRGLK